MRGLKLLSFENFALALWPEVSRPHGLLGILQEGTNKHTDSFAY